MYKLDAMFFTANEEPCKLLGVEGDHDDSFRDYDTFILCNPNAMAY